MRDPPKVPGRSCRPSGSVTKLRQLLLTLLLPALVLPDGITVCLQRLAGRSPVKVSRTCCCARNGATRLPSLVADACRDCCIQVPATERSLDPTTKKLGDDALAATSTPIAALTLAVAPEPPLATDLVARSCRTLHPPPIVPILLPLRL